MSRVPLPPELERLIASLGTLTDQRRSRLLSAWLEDPKGVERWIELAKNAIDPPGFLDAVIRQGLHRTSRSALPVKSGGKPAEVPVDSCMNMVDCPNRDKLVPVFERGDLLLCKSCAHAFDARQQNTNNA